MSVPTAAGTRRVAGVSRRRPRSGPVRVRVGGWLDVITPPSSHMCGGREAPPRASRRWRGGGRGGTAAAGRPWGAPTGGRRGGAERVCVCARLPKMRRGVPSPYSCGARRTGMPRAPNSAATSGLRADRRIRFGVLCRIRASMAGAPGHGVGHGTSVPTSPATRTFPATGFRPLAGAEARPPRARLSASARSPSSSQPRLKPRPPPRTAHPPPVKPRPPPPTAHPRPVKPRPPLRTARPPPVKPRPPLSPGKGHFCAISGRQGRLEFHRTRRPTTQGRLEFHPATRLPLATVEMSQTAASRARLPHDRAQRGSTTGLRARPGQRSGGRRACVSPRSAANRFT